MKKTSFKQPKFWKQLERHPLSADYPDTDGPIWVELVATVKEHGVVDRQIVLHDGKVLDGWQLQRACVECDVKPTYAEKPEHIPAEDYVKIKNDLRRPTKEEEAIRRLDERRKRVAKKHADGESTRDIAKAEGVSQMTVMRDLKASGETPPVSPDRPPPPEPPKVTGADGKSYPASKPKPLCERCARVGPVKDCEKCAAVKDKPKPPPPKPTKSGKAAFDDKRFNKPYGELVRFIDARGNKVGKDKHHKKCIDLLGELLDSFTAWKKVS